MRPGDRIRSLQGPILGARGQRLRGRQPDAHRCSSTAPDVYGDHDAARPPGGSRTCPTTTSASVDLLVELEPRRAARRGAAAHRLQLRRLRRVLVRDRRPADLPDQLRLITARACSSALATRDIAAYVHAGSSSEYGDNAAGPGRARPCAAQQRLRGLQGRRGEPDPLLRQAARLPLREPAALLGLRPAGGLVAADPERDPPRPARGATRRSSTRRISRDFVYIDDVVEAFVDAARELREADYGESFNIGTGRKTTIGERRRGWPASCSASTPSRVVHACRRALGRAATGTPTPRKRADACSAGSRARSLRDGTASARPRGTAACPTRSATAARPRRSALDTELQRQRRHRLLQGRAGDPDHVRAADGDVRRS